MKTENKKKKCFARKIIMKDNYDNFDQTIMGLEASQTEDPLNQAPQPANHYGAVMEETCSQSQSLNALLPA